MKIKIISDLHLGVNGDISNNFRLGDVAFLQYLQDSIRNYDAIIFNGDTFEMWEDFLETKGFMIKDRILDRLHRILASWCFGELIRTSEKIHIVSGNHDSVIKFHNNFENKIVSDRMIIDHNKFHIFVSHGHQGDIYCDETSCLSHIICCASQVKSSIENFIDENLDSSVEKLKKCLNVNDDKITKYAINLTKSNKYDVVVFGHTHNQLLIPVGKNIYVNDGCLCDSAKNICECIITITDCLNIENNVFDIEKNEIVKSVTIKKILS